MRHPVLLTLSFFLIAFFTLLQLNTDFQIASPTGAAIAQDEREQTHYAYTLDHVLNGYLDTLAVHFPRGSCGDTIRELYDSLALTPLEVTSGYKTNGPSRVASLNFGMERSIGTLDIVTGDELNTNEFDTLVSIQTHSTVRMPPGVARLTPLRINLQGTRNGFFIVERGDFSTPALDCSFNNANGKASCQCSANPPESSTDESWTEA